MATKKIVYYVCDRCKKDHKRPLPHQLKINVSARKWTTWDLCAYCFEGLGDFLNAGHPDSDDQ